VADSAQAFYKQELEADASALHNRFIQRTISEPQAEQAKRPAKIAAQKITPAEGNRHRAASTMRTDFAELLFAPAADLRHRAILPAAIGATDVRAGGKSRMRSRSSLIGVAAQREQSPMPRSSITQTQKQAPFGLNCESSWQAANSVHPHPMQ
jgi:hypothetical protein